MRRFVALAFSLPFAALAILTTAAPAHAQRSLGFAIGVGAAIPTGDLSKVVNSGISVGVRRESGGGAASWALRGGLTFDRFSGKGMIDNYQFFTFATELVHRNESGRFYQFGGVGLYNSKTVYIKSAATGDPTNPLATNPTQSELAFGFQGGLGVNFTEGSVKTFLEIQAVDVLTTGRSSVWIPVRFGVRI